MLTERNTLQFTKARQCYHGAADTAARFLVKEQAKNRTLWKKFVNQFREQLDGTNRGWRGEYWGKTMRGAVMLYEYTQDTELYSILTESVRDMLTVAEDDGRVSSFSRDTEFTAWDIWCRKYVLLGMQYYYNICRDDAFRTEILTYLCNAADYILARIGKESEGKKALTACCYSWLGLNSASILEPMVWLYSLSGEQRYLDFATYIVDMGASHMFNLFEMAYENKLYPYQYGVEKAYEMISCFEGLIAYYRVTGVEKHRIAAINFGKALIESETSVIGSCGCTHELFDHTATRQTADYDGVMQETCVTVTFMKLCGQLLRLSGEHVFADAMERSFYNAYLGSLNVEHCHCDYMTGEREVNGKMLPITPTYLPFDSYSPLRPDKRGKKTAGSQVFSDSTYYGCCAAIGAAGVGTFLKHAVMTDDEGIVLNFYENGKACVSYNGTAFTVKTETAYPASGDLKFTVNAEKPANAALKIRIPVWSERTEIQSTCAYTLRDGYAVFKSEWNETEEITLSFDMRIRETHPITWDYDVLYTKTHYTNNPPIVVKHKWTDDLFVSLSRGPLTLACDSRMEKSADSSFTFARKGDEISCGLCENNEIVAGTPCLVKCAFHDENGKVFYLIDYASAGRDWKTRIAAWLPIA